MIPFWNSRWLLCLGLLLAWKVAGAQTPVRPETTEVWKPLMEVKSISYAKDEARRSYQFFALNAEGEAINLEQTHQYGFVWDFGKGRMSLEAAPTMIFEDDAPDIVSLRLTPLKQTGGNHRPPRPIDNNCGLDTTFIRKMPGLHRGRVPNTLTKPRIRIQDPGFAPVVGRCTKYLVEIKLPETTEMSSDITISGFLPEEALSTTNQLVIKKVLPSPGLRMVDSTSTKVQFKADPAKGATYYVLLECELRTNVPVGGKLQWKVNGTFEPTRPTEVYKTTFVDTAYAYALGGSLDPSWLYCDNSRPARTGDTAYYHLVMTNDGTGEEDEITIWNHVPMALDFNNIKVTKALWNGEPTSLMASQLPISRRHKWVLDQGDFLSLKKGESAEIFFQAPIIGNWDCPKHKCEHRKGTPAVTIDYDIFVEFSEDHSENRRTLPELGNDRLKLLCSKAKLHKIKRLERRKCLIATAAAGVGVATTVIVIDRVKHAEK